MRGRRLFQSTPVIANGRIRWELELVGLSGLFQSTPVIANGRIVGEGSAAAGLQRFNPRPLLLTGESENAVDGFFGFLVSIHARYC